MALADPLARARAVAAALLALAGAQHCLAGRPLATEDASVLEEGRCQVEAWTDRARDATTGWIAPACNVGAGIEWQVGGARTRESGAHRFSEAYVQAKAVLTPPDAAWGVGLVLGVARFPSRRAQRGWENPYAVVPVSVAWGEVSVHANVGWSRDRFERRDVTLWGLAVEVPAGERLTFVAETYGENSNRPAVRSGGRFSVLPNAFDIDLTFVTRPGGPREERFVSIGVFWQSDRFLK